MLTEEKAPLSISQLRRVPMTRPKGAGSRWKGIPHAQLMTTLQAACLAEDFGFSNFHAAISRMGADVAASFCLPNLVTSHRLTPFIGLVASNSGRKQLTYWIGALTKGDPPSLEGAPVVVGSLAGSRYEVDLDLKEEIRHLLTDVPGYLLQLDEMIDPLEKAKLLDHQAIGICALAGDRKIIPASRAFKVLDRWRGCYNQTAWQLIRCFGFVVSMNPPHAQFEQCRQFLELVRTAPQGS